MEEYIPKLHIHQHSLLTRKVFFRHNFQHWSSSLYQLDHLVFKSSSSSSHLRLQVIIIFKSSSSNLDHFSIWIIIEHHHWIWIITRYESSSLDWIWIITQSGSTSNGITGSRSSLDLDQHHWNGSGSSLDLDLCCWIWIITRSGSLGVIITIFGS